jgi:hypothetical protein
MQNLTLILNMKPETKHTEVEGAFLDSIKLEK